MCFLYGPLRVFSCNFASKSINTVIMSSSSSESDSSSIFLQSEDELVGWRLMDERGYNLAQWQQSRQSSNLQWWQTDHIGQQCAQDYYFIIFMCLFKLSLSKIKWLDHLCKSVFVFWNELFFYQQGPSILPQQGVTSTVYDLPPFPVTD